MNSNKNTFITWKQAINLDMHKTVAERYHQKVIEITTWFTKNSLAMMFHNETFGQAIELLQVYAAKDYSRYLFDKTEELFQAYEVIEREVEAAKPTFQEVSQLVSSIYKSKRKHDTRNRIETDNTKGSDRERIG